MGKGHKFGPEFTRVTSMAMAPNTALFFVRTDWSYHGVEILKKSGAGKVAQRRLLAFDLFK